MSISYNPAQPYNINGVDFNIVYDNVKTILANSFSTYLFKNKAKSINGGEIVITIPNTMTDGIVYDKANLQSQNAGGIQLSYKINNDRLAAYEINLFDIEINRGPTAKELQEMCIASIPTAIENGLLCEYTKLVSAEVSKHSDNQLVLANFVNGDLTDDQAKTNVLAWRNFMNKYTKLMNKQIIGANPNDFLSIIDSYGQTNCSKYLQFSNSDQSFLKVGVDGGKSINKAFGIVYTVEDLIINNFVSANQSFNSLSYDFTNILGLMIHPEAVAFDYQMGSVHYIPVSGAINRFEIPYAFGGGVYRPSLVAAIVKTQTGTATIGDAIVSINSQDLIVGTATGYTVVGKPSGVDMTSAVVTIVSGSATLDTTAKTITATATGSVVLNIAIAGQNFQTTLLAIAAE